MSLIDLNCGYIPLVDCAPLVIAKELNFAADEGLNLHLLQQPSWSALRDMLVAGHLDAAHMLAPLPIALALGLNSPRVEIDTLMTLNLNGNTMCVSVALAERMRDLGWSEAIDTPVETGRALLSALDRPLRIGVPFPYSIHRLLLDYWLRSNPAHYTESYQIVTLPPPRMANALVDGSIDAFCVGEPWGSVSVQSGAGQVMLTGSAVWAGAPEKVLAARRDWCEDAPEKCAALMRAVYRASQWLDTPENKVLAVEILARTEHLALSMQVIEPALYGRITPKLGAAATPVPGFLTFHHGATTFPWKSQAAWIASRLMHPTPADMELAKDCHRTDLYRSVLGPVGADLPGASEKVEGALTHATAVASTQGQIILAPDAFFDGEIFDPAGSV